MILPSELAFKQKRIIESAEVPAKRTKSEGLPIFEFTDSGPIPYVHCASTLPSIDPVTSITRAKLKELSDEVLTYAESIPKYVALQVCKWIVLFKSGMHCHYKKRTVFDNGTKSLFYSCFIIKTNEVAFACILTKTRIGEGGQSKVSWAALLKFDNQEGNIRFKGFSRAIKHTTLIPENMQNFAPQYAAQIALTKHPHVSTPYFYAFYEGKKHKKILQVFDLYRGNLAHYHASLPLTSSPYTEALKEADSPLLKEVAKLACQLGSGILGFYQNGFVHCDIKRVNILARWDRNGIKNIQLCDLGMCRQIGDPALLQSHRGTLSYSAPEVALKRLMAVGIKYEITGLVDDLLPYSQLSAVTPAIDIWGFSLVLLESLARRKSDYTLLLDQMTPALRVLKSGKSTLEEKTAAKITLQDQSKQWCAFVIAKLQHQLTPAPPSTLLSFINQGLSYDPLKRPTHEHLKDLLRQLEQKAQ